MAAAAPLVHIPLSGTPYAWWSLLQSGDGTLHLEADGRGRQAIALDGPVAAVKEMLVVDSRTAELPHLCAQ